MGEESSVCEALQLLIWPSVKGVVGVRSFARSPGGACHPKFVVPSSRASCSFSWGPPGLAPLAAGSLHAHLFYRCRLEVPMSLCTRVPKLPSRPVSLGGCSCELRSWVPLPAASSHFLATTSKGSTVQPAQDDDDEPRSHCQFTSCATEEEQTKHRRCSVKYHSGRPRLPPAGCSPDPPSSPPHAFSPPKQHQPHTLLPRRLPRPQHLPQPLHQGKSSCHISSSARRRNTSRSTTTREPEAQRNRP